MTEKQFDELQVGDVVKIYGVLGKVVEKDKNTYTVMSRAFGVDDFNDFGSVSFAWNEGEPLESRKPKNMKETEDKDFFTVRWLKENIDLKDQRLDSPYDSHVEIYIEDNTTDDGLDAGCIDIVYCGDVYWTLSKGTCGKEWNVSMDSEPRNDSWLPSVVTIEDFKRLFRVAAGFDLPLKGGEE